MSAPETHSTGKKHVAGARVWFLLIVQEIVFYLNVCMNMWLCLKTGGFSLGTDNSTYQTSSQAVCEY